MDYEVIFQTKGRLRIKIKRLYKNYKLAEAISSISQDEYTFSIYPNIYTSNALIVFDYKKTNAQSIIILIKNVFNQYYDYNAFNKVVKRENNIDEISHKRINHINIKNILKNNLFKKYVFNIDRKFYVKRALIGLGFISLLWYKTYLALLIVAVYFINRYINLLLLRMYKNKIEQYSKLDLSEDFNGWNKYKNCVTPVDFSLNRIELISISTALMTLYFGVNPILVFTIIMLSLINKPFLTNQITYISAYYNMLKKHILLNNIRKIQNFETIETIIFLVNNNNIYINEKIIEDIRERGVLEIKIISNSKHSYLNQLQDDLGIDVSFYNSLENGLYSELYLLKNQTKNIALVSSERDLFITKKIADGMNLNILISNNFDKKNKNFDIVLLENNIDLIGDTIDYIKYIKEKVLQNQIMYFWIYILCIILAFNKNSPLFIWSIATLKKILVYRNSLKPLKYNFKLSMG